MNYTSKQDKILASVIALLSVILIYLVVWVVRYADSPRVIIQQPVIQKEDAATLTLTATTTPAYIEPSIATATIEIKPPVMYEYIEVTDGCGVHFAGACINVRSGPGINYPSMAKLRNGIVLKTSEKVIVDGRTWYKITFDEWVRYPERVSKDWYVAGDFVRPFMDQGIQQLEKGETPTTTKSIIVDLSEQKLYAYDKGVSFMTESVSTGIASSPTPVGNFSIFKKMPSRYMQGPLPGVSEDVYDLPGVPYTMYFTNQGAAFHGAYWHDEFGHLHSHGCVNLPLDKARELYYWAELGTRVTVRE